MKLRYTRSAARQLDRVLGYINERDPRGARHVRERIDAIIDLLLRYPQSGQMSSRPGMRRIVATPYPYAIFYRVGDGEIIVHNVRHTSRRLIEESGSGIPSG